MSSILCLGGQYQAMMTKGFAHFSLIWMLTVSKLLGSRSNCENFPVQALNFTITLINDT